MFAIAPLQLHVSRSNFRPSWTENNTEHKYRTAAADILLSIIMQCITLHLSKRVRAVRNSFTLLDRNSAPRGSVSFQKWAYGLVPVIGVLCALRRF